MKLLRSNEVVKVESGWVVIGESIVPCCREIARGAISQVVEGATGTLCDGLG